MDDERDDDDDECVYGSTAVEEPDVAVADREEERSFLRTTNTLRLEKMDDSFLPPRRTLSRSPPSNNSGTDDGEATTAVMARPTQRRGKGG